MQKILVTGGAGYIGSHLVMELLSRGYKVSVVDNLSTGYQDSISPKAEFFKGDLCDETFIKETAAKVKPDAVIHLAAKISVPESVSDPLAYFHNNVTGSLNLLRAMQASQTQNLIFSSTAAVYGGDSSSEPIKVSQAPDPRNPYGASKLMVEDAIEWFTKIYPLKAVALRYFNVAGASLDQSLGQRTKGSTHLIKKISEYIVGKEKSLTVFGNHYATSDGTCVRDYIHVLDLVDVHIKCLEAFFGGSDQWKGLNRFNCGYGSGHSILQVIGAAEKVIGKKLSYEVKEGRAGDPAILVADPGDLNNRLGWKPKYNSLEQICKTAIDWEKKLFNGANP